MGVGRVRSQVGVGIFKKEFDFYIYIRVMTDDFVFMPIMDIIKVFMTIARFCRTILDRLPYPPFTALTWGQERPSRLAVAPGDIRHVYPFRKRK